MTIREIGEKIEQAFIEIIRERRHDSLGNLAKGALFMGSRIYRRLVQFRIWMYDNRDPQPCDRLSGGQHRQSLLRRNGKNACR